MHNPDGTGCVNAIALVEVELNEDEKLKFEVNVKEVKDMLV